MTRNASRPVALLVGISLLFPPSALAGVIRGTIRIPGLGTGVAPEGRQHSARSDRAPDMDAVIYLEEIPPKLEKKLEKKLAKATVTARIVQRGGRFVPRVLAVVAGTTVTFENGDDVYHNVFSPSPARRLDIGKYAPHETRRVTFDRPGVVQLFCDIDPNETGFVLVTPNRVSTRPDKAGRFALPKLPPGNYHLTVWHPARGERTLDVRVPKRGDVALAVRL